MAPPLIVLFDANVFFGAALRSLIMQTASSRVYMARWTTDIDDEWMAGREVGIVASGQPCFRERARYPDGMNIKIIVHDAEEGGFWAEVPALPGCASQGDTMDEVIANVREAIAGWLTVDVRPLPADAPERVLDLVL